MRARCERPNSDRSLFSHSELPCAALLQIDCAVDNGCARAAICNGHAHRSVGAVRAAHGVKRQRRAPVQVISMLPCRSLTLPRRRSCTHSCSAHLSSSASAAELLAYLCTSCLLPCKHPCGAQVSCETEERLTPERLVRTDSGFHGRTATSSGRAPVRVSARAAASLPREAFFRTCPGNETAP